jgi:hypothetical protein
MSVFPSQSESSQNYIKTDGQPVLVSGTRLRPATKFLLFKIIFRQLRVCWCGEPSLTGGWVCSLQLLLGLASTVFHGSDSRGTHVQVLRFQTWYTPSLESQVPVFISPRNRVAQLYPIHWFDLIWFIYIYWHVDLLLSKCSSNNIVSTATREYSSNRKQYFPPGPCWNILRKTSWSPAVESL